MKTRARSVLAGIGAAVGLYLTLWLSAPITGVEMSQTSIIGTSLVVGIITEATHRPGTPGSTGAERSGED